MQSLILAPTRELALQVADSMIEYGKHLNVRVLAVYGGQPYGPQISKLNRGVDIVVGTPGRLLDLIERNALNIKHIRTLVLDEADEMLNMGFIEDVEKIMDETPSERQTDLFSATMPPRVRSLADRFMRAPQPVTIKRSTLTVSTTEQRYDLVHESDKTYALTRTFTAAGENSLLTDELSLVDRSILTTIPQEKIFLQLSDLFIDSTSAISANGTGYPPGTGPGAGQLVSDTKVSSGGGYGGEGSYTSVVPQGSRKAPGGLTYGSAIDPDDFGSGGTGGSGGGAIILNVSNTLTIEGVVSANGISCGCCYSRSGGSGGTINIHTNNLEGSGKLMANGGLASPGYDVTLHKDKLRVLRFAGGRVTSSDPKEKVVFEKQADNWSIEVDDFHFYSIPEAVIDGG